MTKLHHIGIVVKNIDKYVDILTKLGGKYMFEGVTDDFEAECVFIQFNNTLIELVKGTIPGNHLNKFVEKYGEGLHHIAILTDIENGKAGALPKMKCLFNKPNDDCRILIEKVDFDE